MRLSAQEIACRDIFHKLAATFRKYFRRASIINDIRYRDREEENTEAEQILIKGKETNFSFRSGHVRSIKGLSRYTSIPVRNLRDIEIGEEFFVVNGDK